MAESQGQLICRLCQLRDEMKKTVEGRAALEAFTITLAVAAANGITLEAAKKILGEDEE